MSLSVLVIDDNETIRAFLKDALEEHDYTVAMAGDAKTGLSMIPNWKPDVILLDIQMPGVSGVRALKEIHAYDPSLAVIMITSVDEVESVRTCLTEGAYDYLLKPLDLPLILETIERAADARMLRLEVETYRTELESLVFSRTEELEDALARIEVTYNQTILALGSALESRDVETQEHSLRVARYTIEIARRLGITDSNRLKNIKRGAFLHDIGKIGVPDAILLKPGPLTTSEWNLMRKHPGIGVRLLEGIEFLRDALPIVASHHEWWNGKGYPEGRVGEDIPLEARIFSVADALDAITSDRPYREGRPMIDAMRVIATSSGAQFDPNVVGALRDIPEAVVNRIRFETGHPYRLEIMSNDLGVVVES